MAVVRNTAVHHTYLDSVGLMQRSRELSQRPGVEEAAMFMGTAPNLDILRDAGLLQWQPDTVAPDDVLVAVRAASEQSAADAIQWAIDNLTGAIAGSKNEAEGPPRAADDRFLGWRRVPADARLAMISVPGPYAAAESWMALRAGLHVFLFSDHVSVEDEVSLKAAASERGLLMMGPECGTAVIGGVPLGFANVVARGPIGCVAASGTGLQEVMCLIDRLGGGISHAVGTGGRDLSAAVGGAAMAHGIQLLQEDDSTRVIVLISKPADAEVTERVLAQARVVNKPVVVCFIGAEFGGADGNVHYADTLEGAARVASRLAGATASEPVPDVMPEVIGHDVQVRGLFSGGTLAYEALVILQRELGPVRSNLSLEPDRRWDPHEPIDGHLCLDLGAERFTMGQPHPMIDPTTRARFLADMAHDPRAGVFLLDVVLGTGCHPDPAGALRDAIEQARETARSRGAILRFIASVTGTDADAQVRAAQVTSLRDMGVTVASSNASAARIAAHLASR